MKKIIFTMVTCMTSLAFAIGGNVGNGGDMCENRFKIVRDDLSAWILGGGSQDLQLPQVIGRDLYNRNMLNAISGAKITCTEDRVLIGNSEKTCKNFVDIDGSSYIVCNAKRFLETPESDQYVLVHHEYAGLAGFEVNNGEDSKYPISNQITGYLENQIVKKLVVKPNSTGGDPFDPKSCEGNPMTESTALQYFQPGAILSNSLGKVRFYQRKRICNALTGCSEWSLRTPIFGFWQSASDYNAQLYYADYKFSTTEDELKLAVENKEVAVKFPAFGQGLGANCLGLADGAVNCSGFFTSKYGDNPHERLSNETSNSPWGSIENESPIFKGILTNQCVRLQAQTYRSATTDHGNYFEVTSVLFGKF